MSHECKCEAAGYCPIFNRMMVGRRYAICRGSSGLSESRRRHYIAEWKKSPEERRSPTQTTNTPDKSTPSPIRRRRVGLGDTIEKALTLVGITSERIEKVLGKNCKCKERRDKLNKLGTWAMRILKGKTDSAEEHLNSILEE